MSFHRVLVSVNPNLALKYCSDVTGGHKCHLKVKTGGQSLKSTVLDLWVSFHRFFVSGNPNLALKYCSDVTVGLLLDMDSQIQKKHL